MADVKSNGGKKSRTKKVDRKKLKKALNEKGVAVCEASVEMGYGHSSIHSSLNRSGGLSRPMLKALETRYGITYDMIKLDESKPEVKKEAKETVKETASAHLAIDENRLYQIIYSATYHAFRRVLLEDAPKACVAKIENADNKTEDTPEK